MTNYEYMTPAVTIFDENGAVDVEGNKNLYRHLIKGGMSGIVILGSSGEFFNMSMNDKKVLIDTVLEEAKDKTKVIVGTGSMNIKDTIELSNYALEKGADAVMVIAPYYFALDKTNIIKFFTDIANKVKGNIYLYNFPERTGYDLTPEIILELATTCPNIVGVKDTVTEMGHTRDIIELVTPKVPTFKVLSGFDDNYVHNITSNGAGNISAISNVYPEVFGEWIEAVKQNNYDKIKDIQLTVNKMMRLYNISPLFIQTIKTALYKKGIIKCDYTVDILPLTKEQEADLDTYLKEFDK